MKKITKIVAALSLAFILSVSATNMYAQTPGGVPADPSLPGGSSGPHNGAVGHPAGSGADLSGGVWLMLLLGGLYGGYKIYSVKKEDALSE